METRRLKWVVTLALLVAVAFAAVVSASGPDAPGADLSILDRPATGADRLSEKILAGTAGEVIADPSATRHLGTYSGHEYYVAPAANDQLCLIDRDDAEGSTGLMCGERSEPEAGMWMGGMDDQGREVVVMLVPDGYDTAAPSNPGAVADATRVEDNHAFFVMRDATSIELRGPDKRDVTVEVP
jgi:hypothetical protein